MKITSTSHQATLEDTISALQSQIKDLEFNLALSHRENDKLSSEVLKLKNESKAFDWNVGMPADFKLPDLKGKFISSEYYIKSSQTELSKKHLVEPIIDTGYLSSPKVVAGCLQGTLINTVNEAKKQTDWDSYRGEWRGIITDGHSHNVTDPGHSHDVYCANPFTHSHTVKEDDKVKMASEYFRSICSNIY